MLAFLTLHTVLLEVAVFFVTLNGSSCISKWIGLLARVLAKQTRFNELLQP